MSWASPIELDKAALGSRRVTRLVTSSPAAWTTQSDKIVPDYQAHPEQGFPDGKDKARRLLAVAVEGEFESYFAGKPSPLAEAPEGPSTTPASASSSDAKKAGKPVITGVIERSPDSARIVLLGSSSFFSDEVLNLLSGAERSQVLTPVTFAANVVDWSLEDRGLLALRSRGGHFARTLAPLDRDRQIAWEYGSYALAFLGLALVFVFRRLAQRRSTRRHAAMLQMQGA